VREGRPSRRFWEAAAELGILGIGVPEEYGGARLGQDRLSGSDAAMAKLYCTERQGASSVDA
jgi:alkylation response protein AidB-like acyl-CoA dehydrogenase